MEPRGYLAIVLHAHLPYVRHPEHEDFLEERWLFEAMTECYLPLLDRFRAMRAEGIAFRITMSLTPTLASMLRDELLMGRYDRHLGKLQELADRERRRAAGDGKMEALARFYEERLGRERALWEEVGRDVVGAFADLERTGHVEVLTCGATHGFLPLLAQTPTSVRAQVAVGCRTHQRLFGHRPRGIWLPECAYFPGLDEVLAEEGLRFFVVDTHGIEHATPRPLYGVHAPVYTPAGVAAFGRDTESSKQVWSADEGYPGDFAYRDFYRDIGFDRPLEEIRPYINPDGTRLFTGIKYHRITARTDHKELYDPAVARERAASHAGHFMWARQEQVKWLAGGMDRPPIVVAPYDAELFGHWWFEGPDFLEYLFRKIHYDQEDLRPVTLAEYLQAHPVNQKSTPSASTWGAGGYHQVWLEGSNAWMYRHAHHAAREMNGLARDYRDATGALRRALEQAGRELLLLESSDWAFILKTATSTDYAIRRFKAHLARFRRLSAMIRSGSIDERWLGDLEWRDNIFPDVQYQLWS
ncbi:MAG: DUF1957 domain-containing protein [Deltaproteobacteria bacterium]|nr:DUF1957 domain-containing protein [Deltaproteobacteria bacterium]